MPEEQFSDTNYEAPEAIAPEEPQHLDELQEYDSEKYEETRNEDNENPEAEQEPEEFDFEEYSEAAGEDALKDLNGFDVSGFADKIDLSIPENMDRLEELSSEAKRLGLNQEQAEFMLDNFLTNAQAPEPEVEPTAEEIKKNLDENLTRSEKRDYGAVGNFLKSRLKGTDSEAYIADAMKNPGIYKFVRDIYRSTLSNERTVKDVPRSTRTIRTENILDVYVNKIREGVSRKDATTQILDAAANKAEARKILGDYI